MAHSASTAAAAASSRARLAPFVQLAQTASGAAAAQLCADATAAPGVYAFAELLGVQSVREVSRDAGDEARRRRAAGQGIWTQRGGRGCRSFPLEPQPC